MDFIVAFLKKLPWISIGLFVGGLVLGLTWGYVISPVEFVDADPSYLRAELQEDYMRMAIDSYRLNQDPNLAVQRWKALGVGAQQAFGAIQANPKNTDPAVVQSYGELITNVLSGEPIPVEKTGLSIVQTATLGIGVIVLLGVLAYGGLYLYRLLGNRGSGEVTPTMQAVEMSRKAEKTNFEQLGLAPPITQTMTTYVLGDDLYDESFSIDTQAGEFMGEYGVGVSEAIGVGDPKKVTALEFWLFDKNDIKTATKVLMSRHAFNDPGIRARLEPKGELVLVEPQSQVLLETATLQLLATVVDLEYGKGPLPADSYFERITLELAIWPRQG
ncbi:MAG: hypothetical protein IPL71_21820 [Anaerolineales bacterium]|uniref:hypothetical protein n=1 Tax=Candidatus Villigracilis proximus TaxID=3140683 RepID=UPI00313686E4|nr:hypothetical protein [Anaerolineales bacterium]